MLRHEALPRLWAISDRRAFAGEAARVVAWVRTLARAGVEGLQLREKDLDDRQLYELARALRSPFEVGVLTVNGRADVAIAAGADGVHLPADGVPIAALRRRFGARLLIGRSTHSAAEVAAAAAAGADYVTFGPVFETPEKERFGSPQGLERLAEAARHGVPVVAVGGLSTERFAEVAAAGAVGAAGIRLFLQPEALADIVAAATASFRRPAIASPAGASGP